MSVFAKSLGILAVIGIGLVGLRNLNSAPLEAAAACCCGVDCPCELCDCDGTDCTDCQCPACDCAGCGCDSCTNEEGRTENEACCKGGCHNESSADESLSTKPAA